MKIKKPTKKTMTNTAATGVGVVVGIKVSKAAESFLSAKNETFAKVGVAVVGAGLAMGVEGADAVSHAVRGAGLGMLIDQGVKALDKAVNGKIPADSKVLKSMFPGGTTTSTLSPSIKARLAGRMGNIEANQYKMASPSYTGGFVAQ